MPTEDDIEAEAKAIMAGPGSLGERAEAVRRLWMTFVVDRGRPLSVTGECAECGGVIERPPGQRGGRLPRLCPTCRESGQS